MATITSTAAGNWSAGATWIGGVAPVDGDKANLNHAITVDDTLRAVGVDGATDSLLIGAAGTLKWSRTASSLFTLRGNMVLNANGAQFDMGKVADEIPAAFTAGLVLNKYTAAPGFQYGITQNGSLTSYGFYIAGETSRNRIAKMTSAVVAGAGKTFTVDSATGWQIGDVIAVGHSDPTNPAVVQYERVTLTAIAPLTATFAYPHAVGCFMGNMHSNVQISSFNVANPAGIQLDIVGLTSQTVEIRNALFTNLGRFGNGQGGIRFSDNATGSNVTSSVKSFFGNVHYNDSTGYTSGSQIGFANVNRPFTVDSSIFYNDVALTGSSTFAMEVGEYPNFNNCVSFGANLFYSPVSTWIGTFTGGMCCSNQGYVMSSSLSTPGSSFVGTIFSGYLIAFGPTKNESGISLSACDVGVKHGWKSVFGDNFYRLGGKSSLRLAYDDTGSSFAAAAAIPTDAVTLANMGNSTLCTYTNKGADVTVQERYYRYGTVKRGNTLRKNSTSAIAIQPTIIATNTQYTASVPVAANGSITLTGNVKYDSKFYNGGTWTAPTVSITGLGIVAQTFTAAATAPKAATFTIAAPTVVNETAHGRALGSKVSFATTGTFPTGITTLTSPAADASTSIEYYVSAVVDANNYNISATYGGANIACTGAAGAGHTALTWQAYTLTATNNIGTPADGNFTATFTANASTVVTGTVYFDGVPTSTPYVTKARTYGRVFDQTTTGSAANASVSASEATANAYTDVTYTWGASQTNIALAASSTFQKVYDGGQAQSCRLENQANAVPCSAPALGVLITAGNVATTGFSLTGSGSLAMGAYVLTSEFTAGGYAYTYTAGTYSQASAGAAVFTGGTVTMPTLGATTAAMNFTGAGTTLDMKPTNAAANYNCGGGTFTGTTTITNTTGITCTLQLPTGTTVNNTTSGANLVTVVTPSVYQSVTVSSAVAGSRIQIYDTTAAVQLYNGTPAFPFTWTDPTPAAATRAIRLRVAYQSGVTAKDFIDANIGTCAVSGAGKDVSYLVAQVADVSYNTSAIDGSTVTGISVVIAGGNLVKFTAGGPATISDQTIYAYQVYWQFTATGIAQETAFITSPDAANFIVASFQFENEVANTIITLNNGYMRDSVTGTPDPLISTTVGKGVVNIVSPHAVLVTTGSGPLTVGQAASLANAETSSGTASTQATLARKFLSNKVVLDPATGIETVYDDAGTVLYTRNTYSDAAGLVLYDGTKAVNRAEKYA